MKKAALVLMSLALMITLPGLVVAEAPAADETTLTGEFKWNRMDEPGPIKAVFTPAGDGKWDVSFYFDFRDEPHVYSGTAEGSLSEGALKGNVMSDGEKPSPFSFEGKFVDGTFEGVHHSLRDEEPAETGTITLSR